MNINDRLIGSSPGESTEICGVNLDCGILVCEISGKVEGVVNVKRKLGSKELKIGALSVIEGDICDVTVHCIVVKVNGKSLRHNGIADEIDVIRNLDSYLGGFTAVLLINGNGML